jgi:hypothetical protein
VPLVPSADGTGGGIMIGIGIGIEIGIGTVIEDGIAATQIMTGIGSTPIRTAATAP